MDLNFSQLSWEDLERIIKLATEEKEDRTSKADQKAINDFLNAWRAVEARDLKICYTYDGDEIPLDNIDFIDIYK
jgi:hypothetical protein